MLSATGANSSPLTQGRELKLWKYTVGGAVDVHINDLAEAGFTFYRIPDLEVAE